MEILAKNLLILASAGSGKTFQLGNRVIGLVAGGVEPEKIVALTFTRKAAGEFADSVLRKLAKAAADPAAADALRRDLGMPQADFATALEKVVRALPRFTLGTIDSFFARVVRGFQYELGLTGGKFDLLEGPRAEAAAEEIMTALLGEALDAESGDEFLHAFRRASYGKEQQGVLGGLRDFVDLWQGHFRASHGLEWGPETLAGVRVEDWEEHKSGLIGIVTRGLDSVSFTHGSQRKGIEKLINQLENHTIGSGSLGSDLLNSVVQSLVSSGTLSFKYYKDLMIGGPAGDALSRLIHLAARCEMAAALARTRAVRELVAVYDARCEQVLRRRGQLRFDDVKHLMGAWVTGEEARLRREMVDFRLDARHEHWLLDEFQDTSRADWLGLLPLVDEAAGAGEGTMFVVGDRKQAIYAWRGGDVTLFDEVMDRYRDGGLRIEPMDQSWRSCPQVLQLVNRVCGDPATMRELFGAAAEKWQWQDHVSAEPLARPDQCGEARVEVVQGSNEDRIERLAELLEELGVGRRELTCGVLVRTNAQVKVVADRLRELGYDVIEEGRRKPAEDNPVGIALWHLLKWLANPADQFARETLRMSPLWAVLEERFGTIWQKIWEGLTERAAAAGFAGMLEELLEICWTGWSDFGRRRAGDILAALSTLDHRGGGTALEAADWIGRLEVSQNPGAAAVQVMTIHKSKGLGFDIVILPEIPSEKLPPTRRFDIAQGADWLTETPPKWARDLIPELRDAEAAWGARQHYESFCMLYVALTRARRGLYVLLEPPSARQEPDHPSLCNWVARAIGSPGTPGTVWQAGSPGWTGSVPLLAASAGARPAPALAGSRPRRERTTPSAAKANAGSGIVRSASGMRFGSEVHAAFEAVGWIDETAPELPRGETGRLISELLEKPELAAIFKRGGRAKELFREQPIDAIVGGKWLSGVIDRLHVERDGAGAVTRVEVIDFKTDRVKDAAELAGRYATQMKAYREVMALAYPGAQVECLLLSTRCKAAVAV